MRFVCDSCRAQYMISDEKVGAKGVKVRCKKCGYVILVRKAEAAPPMSDSADATQVMSNPLGEGGLADLGGGKFDSEMTSPGNSRDNATTQAVSTNGHEAKGFLASVEEDEIGAVFDQVLKTGPNPVGGDESKSDLSLGDDEDRLSTRVLDSETVKKLAEESGLAGFGGDSKESNGKKNGQPIAQDWFVAIDEKQTGPLTVEKLKDLWERGEIGPDSLCWRAGFSDWMPLSEVAELASELAPKPAKPEFMSPAPQAAVVTVPVESAFNAGGVTKTVRSEMPMLASAPVEETGGWKPSAASALASLVKEEIDAMSKPAPKPVDSPATSGARGLLDIPGEHTGNNKTVGTDVAMRSNGLPQPPANMGMDAYAAPSPYAAPYGQYAPPPPQSQGLSKGLTIGLIAAGVLFLGLFGVVLYLAFGKNSQAPTQIAQAPAAAPSSAPAKTEPKKLEMPPPPVAANGQPMAAAPAKAEQAPAAAAAPTPTRHADAKAERAERASMDSLASKTKEPGSQKVAKAERSRAEDEGEGMTFGGSKSEKTEKKAAAPEATGSDDEFNDVFGGGSAPKKREAAEDSKPAKKKEIYVPPAPGSGAGVAESLSSSDVMSVVVQNKPAIMKCVSEQKAKDPDITGTLVMRWQVQTSGRTSNVSVQSDEFKSTYMASCIGGLIKSWQFPQHKVQGDPINFPFKF